MSKKTRDGRLNESDSNAREATPPLLSEKLIAQLQGAVNAAQRNRTPHSNGRGENRMDAKPVSTEDRAGDPRQN
jgi:hypothetical protein